MAKIAALIAALELSATPEHKTLAAEARAEFGQFLELEAKEVASRVQRGEAATAQVNELAKQVKDLDEKAKGAEALKTSLEGYQSRERTRLIASEITAKAKDFGIKAEAVPTILKIADLSAVKVDEKTNAVSGLSKEIFEPLRKEHAIAFIQGDGASGAVTPPPPAGGGADATKQEAPKIAGAVGGFMAALSK